MIISEQEFKNKIIEKLNGINVDCVTGTGRSGAIASVYASHILGIPFIPYGQFPPLKFSRLLIIDTATQSGRTLRKAAKKYSNYDIITIACYNEPPRVKFWYENINKNIDL